jgi:hypothetical protein
MTGRGEAQRYRNLGRGASEAFNFPACAEFCGQRQRRMAYGPVRLGSGCPEADRSPERVPGMRSRPGLRGDQLGQCRRLIFLQEMFAG